MPTFGKSSIIALESAHPDLQRLFREVIKHVDCKVLEGHRDKVAGIQQWSGTAEYLQVMSNAGHKSVADVMLGRVRVDGYFYPTGSSSDGYFNGDMYLTGWGLAHPNEDALAANITFEGTGALTRTSSST